MLPITELIKELESGNTSLARCLSTQPGLSFDEQIDLALSDQKIRHGRGESYGVKCYTQTFPWLLSEPSQLYRLIKGEVALSLDGETAFVFIERFAVDHPQVLPSTLEQLRSLARSDEDQTASLIDFDSRCDSLCDSFEELLKSGRLPRIESWLERVPSAHRKELFRNLVLIEVYYQSRSHRSVIDWQQYQERFPEYRSLVDEIQADSELNADFGFSAKEDLSGSFISKKKVGDLRNGRYRLERLLGHGSYGDVYLAQDLDLRRQVAIKLPRKQALANLVNVESYLVEARNAASLDHPHIITIYDVGRTLDGSIYVVSRFIDGRPLDELIKDRLFDFRTAVQLLLQVSEALDHAHQRRLVHRDIKPANILVEEATGKPYIADFGLSIREEDYLQEGRIAGTPSYMSPEQVRGEGHRLDGRSDLFSLGVVMYQILTGSLPFVGATNALLEKQILHEEPAPLRYLKPAIPEEIDRICLKLLRKRASERYSRGRDLADDLRNWLDPSTENRSLVKTSEVMPRGLRSFTAEDAGFFLDLLPGPRDRQGLPEAVAFWKNKIAECDADLTFAVGLLYGPSGSGKSSLVKAGLIPNLPEDVISIYVEATPDGTEDLLLRGLNKKVPATRNKASLTEALQLVRREHIVKVVIFIDQFEQWLHANPDVANASLSSALRQCDGSRLQCVVLIRDDFAMAAARFLDALDIPIVQGRNFAFTDLFDTSHAKKVLIKFGQAFGRLPLSAMEMGFDQQAFIEKLVIDLTQDGKVVPVRLSLLVEIIKDEPWTAETLKLFGGMEGLGVSFMERAFGSRTANPTHRLHQQAARRVVSALLPENDGDIKACMRSYSDLLKISGYENQPYEFDVLLRIMDSELRLITPTEPGGDRIGGGHARDDRTDRYYQLTHDYLIPSLRRWLIQKQTETRKGLAEIKLAQSALSWNSNKDANLLPSLWDWFSIRRHTDNQRWTAAEWAMMHYATRYHAQRMVLIALCLTALFSLLAVFDRQWVASKVRQTQVRSLVDSLLIAETGLVPDIIEKLDENIVLADQILAPILKDTSDSTGARQRKLRARLAVVSRNASVIQPVLEELLGGTPDYVLVIRDFLRQHSGEIAERLTQVLMDAEAEPQRRFRAAVALADYDPSSDRLWHAGVLEMIVKQLISSNIEFQPLFREGLRPIHEKLLPLLESAFTDEAGSETHRLAAAYALADYAVSDVPLLARLLAVATPEQYAVLFPIVSAGRSEETIMELAQVVQSPTASELGSDSRVVLGKKRANAAITLIRLEEKERAISVFDWSDDPEALTQFIVRCKPRQVKLEALLDLLDQVAFASVGMYPKDSRYALILAIGEYAAKEIPSDRRAGLIKLLSDWYANDPSSGVHGASGWLLRHLGEGAIVNKVDQTEVPYESGREWYTVAVTVKPTPPLKRDTSAEQQSDGESPPTGAATPGKVGADTNEQEVNPSAALNQINGVVVEKQQILPPKTLYFTFIVFPAGEYTIGSVEDEVDRVGDEERHKVTLTRPFAILDRELTFAELVTYSPAFESYMPALSSPMDSAGYGANWYDGPAFCRWLGEQSGMSEADQAFPNLKDLDPIKYPRDRDPEVSWAPNNWPMELGRRGFRLPTEAEWEIAARNGTRTAFSFGGDAAVLNRFGWFRENSGKNVHAPKQLRPSLRGLFDLHGNLFEWTYDPYEKYDLEKLIDPIAAAKEYVSFRVDRGGSWVDDPAYCRSASRLENSPVLRATKKGFRLAVSLK